MGSSGRTGRSSLQHTLGEKSCRSVCTLSCAAKDVPCEGRRAVRGVVVVPTVVPAKVGHAGSSGRSWSFWPGKGRLRGSGFTAVVGGNLNKHSAGDHGARMHPSYELGSALLFFVVFLECVLLSKIERHAAYGINCHRVTLFQREIKTNFCARIEMLVWTYHVQNER